MTAEQVAQIGAFRQFERRYHEQQGIGFGLFIAQHLTRIYEGELDVFSRVGEGTRISVTLPLASVAVGQAPPE
jgi:signal transduction histidine kinase